MATDLVSCLLLTSYLKEEINNPTDGAYNRPFNRLHYYNPLSSFYNGYSTECDYFKKFVDEVNKSKDVSISTSYPKKVFMFSNVFWLNKKYYHLLDHSE